MALPLVRFLGVTKRYAAQARPAVQRLDLDVAAGELLVLLGPSGSGKTTTLMLLAGFESAEEGRILLQGADIARLPPHKRGIGVVFQSYALFPHMSVAENIAFPLAARRVPKQEQAKRVAAALDRVRLAGFGDRRPAQLSGGQQQRVALARAMVFEPPIVLLDEPLGALDKALREEMQHELRALQQRLGLTMLYVTHDQAEALTLADRIGVFHEGRLRQVATPRILYDAPADAFVSGFVGENNALDGVVTGLADDLVQLRLADGTALEASAAEGLAVGDACTVMIRPERVAVAPVAAADLGLPGALAARLEAVLFQGDHLRLRLRLAGGTELVAKRAVGGSALPDPGAEAAIAFEASHARAFRRAPGLG
jgi:putative spermidine/putrescine transport system ATP-binding protein